MRRTWIFAWAWTIGAVLAAEAQTARNATTVSRLPPCNLARQGYWMAVNDADPDCHTGSGDAGSGYAICQCDPLLGWLTYAPGSGGGGSPTGTAGGDLAGTYPNPTIAPNAVALGTDTTGPYAGSASEAGPATSALSVTGFTASKCARFDGSGVLVAASGDCSAGATAGVGGALGSLDNSVPRTVGAGGATLEGTTLTIDDANNLVLGAGAALSGSDNYVRVRTPGGGYNLGNGTFQDSGGVGRSWLINLTVSGSGTQPVYSGAGDINTGSGNCAAGAVCLTASGVEALRATTTAVKVLTLGLTLSSAPPYTCDGATEGRIYADTEDHATCYCTGSAWTPMFGGGSCS